VIVLDGATDPDPSDRNGGWFADVLGRQLQYALGSQHDDLSHILGDAIDAVANEYGLAEPTSPSSTVSIVRWDQQNVDVLVLGDSPVIGLTLNSDAWEVRDNRLRAVARDERRRLRLPQSQPDREVQRQALVAAERRARNTEQGYWIAAATPEVATHALRARWARSDLRAVFAMTDGVSKGVDQYGLFDGWPSACQVALRDPESLVNAVHNAETADIDCQRWPRSKVHDDKALAVVMFDAQNPLASSQEA
jgi:hypothetical protein